MNTKTKARQRRAKKSRVQMRTVGAVRLSVHRTGQHIYAQIIDDSAGKTLAAASTLGADGTGANIEAAKKVGSDIAAAAQKAGVTSVVLDRGGFLFHGRVKALADAAREGGLEF